MIRTRDLEDAGATRAEIDAARKNNTRLTRGFYCDPETDGDRRYQLHCRAVLERLSPAAVLSGPSAAAAWALTRVGGPPTTVYVKSLPRGRYASDVTVLPGPVEATCLDGIMVATPGWTVVDCARVLCARDALIVADAALRAQLTTRTELEDLAAGLRGTTGVGKVRWVVDNADGRSESAGETWARMIVKDLGYEVTPQFLVEDDDFTARIDLLIEPRVGLEFNGLDKYRKPGVEQTVVKVAAETVRSGRLEEIGYRMLAVVWAQLEDPDRLDRRLQHAGAVRVNPQRLLPRVG